MNYKMICPVVLNEECKKPCHHDHPHEEDSSCKIEGQHCKSCIIFFEDFITEEEMEI